MQRNDNHAAVLDRPLQVDADLVQNIAEHTDFVDEPLDGIVQGIAVAFGRPLGCRHRRKMVPESVKPHKNLVLGNQPKYAQVTEFEAREEKSRPQDRL